jgi:hypothetical protein
MDRKCIPAVEAPDDHECVVARVLGPSHETHGKGSVVTAPVPANANPVDDLRQQVADYYNEKFGCGAYRPLICPGPFV